MSYPATLSISNAHTIEVTTTTSDPIDVSGYDRAMFVATGADIFIDADDILPDSNSAAIPMGCPMTFSLALTKTIRAKALAGSGYLTIYPF